jgi:hypothetical protein
MRYLMPVVLPILLAACSAEPPPAPTPQPQQVKPLNPAAVAGQLLAANAAAMVGDQQSAKRHIDAFEDGYRRSMRMADPARRIPPEPARNAVKAVPGVTSAAWVDSGNLLVMVDGAEYRTQAMIDTLCMQLEPLGDTLWVYLHLQNRRARDGEGMTILSRNCQLQPGENAFLQQQRQLNVVDPALRAKHQANQVQTPEALARKQADDRANAEALRRIPQM